MNFDAPVEVELCGKRFTLKEYTRKSWGELQSVERQLNDKLVKGEIDRLEYYCGCLRVILDGDVDALDPDTLPGRKAEAVIKNFMPESMQIYQMLIGS